jgi:hypothetical protein
MKVDTPTSQGFVLEPSTGNPTVVFTAKPTVSPAYTVAVFGAPEDRVDHAPRPQRRSRDEGSVMGEM